MRGMAGKRRAAGRDKGEVDDGVLDAQVSRKYWKGVAKLEKQAR